MLLIYTSRWEGRNEKGKRDAGMGRRGDAGIGKGGGKRE